MGKHFTFVHIRPPPSGHETQRGLSIFLIWSLAPGSSGSSCFMARSAPYAGIDNQVIGKITADKPLWVFLSHYLQCLNHTPPSG